MHMCELPMYREHPAPAVRLSRAACRENAAESRATLPGAPAQDCSGTDAIAELEAIGQAHELEPSVALDDGPEEGLAPFAPFI